MDPLDQDIAALPGPPAPPPGEALPQPGTRPLPTDIAVREPDGAPAPLAAGPAPAEAPPAPKDALDADIASLPDDPDAHPAQQRALTAWQATQPDTKPPSTEPPRAVQQAHLEAQLANQPEVAAYMKDPAKGALAKDDVHQLSTVATGLTERWEQLPRLIASEIAPKALFDRASMFASATVDALKRQYLTYLQNQDASELASPDQRAQMEVLEQELDTQADYGATSWLGKQALKLPDLGLYVLGDWGSRLAGAGVGGAIAGAAGVETGPGAVLTAGTGAAVGQFAGSTAWNYYQNRGPLFRQLVKMKDANGQPLMTEDEARTRSMWASLVAGGVMAGLGGATLKAAFPGVAKRLAQGIATDTIVQTLAKPGAALALRNFAKRYPVAVVEGAALMASQAAVNGITAELSKGKAGQPTDWAGVAKRSAEAFWEGIQTMSLVAGVGAGHQALKDLGAVSRLPEDTKRLDLMSAAAEHSNLRERSPEEFEAFAKDAQGDKPTTIYAKPEEWTRYWQGQKVSPGEKAAEVMGDGGKAFAEAVATGGDLAIPAEKYLRHLSVEHGNGLREYVRLTPDGESMEGARTRLEAKAREAAGAQPEGAPDTAEDVAKHWQDQAVSAGEDPKVAEATGRLVGATFRNLGQAMGLDAMGAYKELASVRILRGAEKPPEALDTSFDFGGEASAEPEARAAQAGNLLEEAKATINRMRPDNREAATAWLEYVTGQRSERPRVTPDMEKQLARFGLVDPAGFPYGEDGRNLERPVTTQKVRGQEPEELRRQREFTQEYKSGRYSQLPRENPNLPALREAYAKLTPEERARKLHLDRVTGLREADVFDQAPVPEGKQVAVITSPAVKGINDHPTAGGHDVANGLLTAMARAVGKDHLEAARGGTNFRILVDSPAELDQVLERVRRAVGPGIDVLGAVGKDTEEAFSKLRTSTDEGRAKGELPKRGELRPELDVAKLSFQGKPVAAKPPMSLVEKMAGTPEAEAFRQTYQDSIFVTQDGKRVAEPTGLLTARGFYETPPRAHTLSIDLKGLGKVPKDVGDRMLLHFARALAREGGATFDAAHLSGDEFAAKADSPQELEALAQRVYARLNADPLVAVDPAGKRVSVDVGFRHGIGADYAQADRDLNARRRAGEAPDARPVGGAVQPGGAGEASLRVDAPRQGGDDVSGANPDGSGAGPADGRGGEGVPGGGQAGDVGGISRLFQGPRDQKNLLVQHNLTEENLAHADQFGGLAVPSIAIARVEAPLAGFGDVTLLGHKDMVDPATGVPVFNRDVWSVRWPDLGFEVKPKEARKLREFLKGSAEKVRLYLGDMEGELNRKGPGEVLGNRDWRAGLGLEFLKERGKAPADAMEDVPTTKSDVIKQPAMQEFIKEHGVKRDFVLGDEYHRALTEAYKKGVEELASKLDDAELADHIRQAHLTGGSLFGKERWSVFDEKTGLLDNSDADKLVRELGEHGKKRVDTNAMRDEVLKLVDSPELKDAFQEWAKEKLKDVFGAPYIRKYRDTANGPQEYRKAYTLENVVNEMTRPSRVQQGEGKGGVLSGLGHILAAAAKRYRSMESIQEDRGKLQPNEATKDAREALTKKVADLAEEMGQYHSTAGSREVFRAFDAFLSAVSEAFKPRRSLERELERDGFDHVPPEMLKKVRGLMQELRDLPDDIFEAKPQRAVHFNEFKAAVVPSDAKPETLAILKKHGLDVVTYERDNPESRQKAIAEAAAQRNILFQPPEGGRFKLNAGKGERGFIEFTAPEGGSPRRFDIHLLEGSDQSTLAHETMHFLSEVLGDVATAEGAPEQLRQDYRTLLDAMGHASHEDRQAAARERRELSLLPERTTAQENRLRELSAKEETVTHLWEQYLAEGKAPSAELAGVFTRFRRWMTSIYRGLSGIASQFRDNFGQDLQLSDAVRGVFDRLLASEEEVQKAQEATQAAQPFEAALSAMTPEERAEYQRVTLEAQAKAEDELRRRIVEGQRNENAAFMREERQKLRTQVGAELDAEPAYRSLQFLQDGTLPDGEVPSFLRDAQGNPMKLDRAELARRYGKDFVATLPRGLFGAEGGAPLELVSTLLGWDDADAMVRALQRTEPRAKLVEREVQQRLEALYGPALLDSPQELATLALDAAHNEDAAQKVVLELRALRRQLDKGASPLDEVLTPETARATAARLVREKSVGELTAGEQGLAGSFLRAERTAARRALQASLDGNLQAAIGEKEKQLLNWALYREAAQARTQLEKAFDKLRGSGKDSWRAVLGKADPAYRDAHDAILQGAGLQEIDPNRPVGLDSFVQKAAADAQEVGFDVQGLRQLLANPTPWRKLTLEQAQNVTDAVTSIRHMANQLTHVELEGKRLTTDAFFQELADGLAGRKPLPPEPVSRTAGQGVGGKLGHLARGADAVLANMETFANMLDNGRRDGPAHRLLVDARLEARAKELELQKQVLEPIRKAWAEVPKDVRKLRGKVVEDVPSNGGPVPLEQLLPVRPGAEGRLAPVYTRDSLWSLFLNWGNEGNRQRIMDGNGWTQANVEKALSVLTKPETDFLQGVLDSIESLYPELARVYEKRTGLPLGKVDATPIRVGDRTYRGGYFPIRYDSRYARQGAVQEADVVASLYPPGYKPPFTASGHTKARLEKVPAPVALDWGVLPAHLAQVTHDIAYGDWVRQTGRIFMDGQDRWRQLSSQYLGPEYAKEFVPWLRDVANARADSASGAASEVLGEVGGFTRGKLAIGVMGLNVPSMMAHLMDPLTTRLSGVPLRHISSAYLKTMARGIPLAGGLIEPAAGIELSPEMAYREAQFTANLRKSLVEMGPKGGGLQEAINGVIFKPHEWLEHFTTTVAYRAAYEHALSEGKSVEDAVKRADDVVRQNFPSGDLADKPALLRSKQKVAAAVMFYGYANKLYNQLSRIGHTQGAAHLAASMLYLGFIGAGAAFLAGRGPDPDEDKKSWLARKVLLDPLNTIPFLGAAAEKLVKGEPVDFRTVPELAYASDFLNRIEKARKHAGERRSFAEHAFDAVNTVIGGSGPYQFAKRTGGYAKDLATGHARPRGLGDVMSGLFYGKRDRQPVNPFSAAQDAASKRR